MKLADCIKACILGLSLAVVPAVQAESPAAEPTDAARQLAVQRVNINTADAATIAGTLTGVGMRKAEAIVAYREEHGPFKTVDELVNVKGIGSKTLEKLRPMIAL